MIFVEILLPLKIPTTYSYMVPQEYEQDVEVGKRALVSFGKSKFYAGIITEIHSRKPAIDQVKSIEQILDQKPILSEKQLRFWRWLSDYYICDLGMVMDTALPNYFKLSSERFYALVENRNVSHLELDEDTEMLLDAIRSMGQIGIKEIRDQFGKSAIASLNKLIDIGAVEPVEIVKEKYLAKYEKYLKLVPELEGNSKAWNEIFQSLQKKSPSQYKTFLSFFTFPDHKVGVLKSELIAKSESSASIIKSMIDKGYFIEYQMQIDRFSFRKNTQNRKPILSESQEKALSDIQQLFESKNVVLLRGITGSGKTELYIKHIQMTLDRGGTALLILPEITLTQQIVSRLSEYFGENFLVYHSLISQNKRYEIWNKVKNGEIKFIVGTRSAIFLPFQQLDTVIIDEEHDSSLKQSDIHPKFHVRDSIIAYSQSFDAKILLGSATPSLDTYFNAMQDRFGLVELTERYGDALIPEVELINLRNSEVSESMKSFYSEKMLNEVELAVQKGEQAILFQNRRGYAPYIQCQTCGFVQKCNSCDVRLTYHSYHRQLVCHYCAKKYPLQSNCIQCKSSDLKTKGLGTQKVEEEIGLFLPNLRIGRLDIDVAKSTTRIDQILSEFKSHEFDLLIGTQMVSKGLDFENLTVVGVVQADNFFSFIDYKTDERAFQTLSQVSGRVGRGKKKGKVLIQTSEPDHRVIRFVLAQDFIGFVQDELKLREQFIYPPYCKILKITIKHIKEDLVDVYARKITQKLIETIKGIVLGPTVPPISRIRNQYIQEIIIKLPKNKELQANKNLIKSTIDSELMTLSNKNFTIDILVDC